MRKVTVIIDDDGQLQGIFSTYSGAVSAKKLLEQATDQFIGPLKVKEIDLDIMLQFKLRKWWLGTINIIQGNMGKSIEGADFTGCIDDYTSHVSLNHQYIEVKSYVGSAHLISTLTRLRNEYLQKKQYVVVSQNG